MPSLRKLVRRAAAQQQAEFAWVESVAAPYDTDRPISDLEADRLDRKDFAVALANALVGWKGDDALVAALFGEWGSGKSSIKNMALASLRRRKWPGLILEFTPWQFAGQDQLFSAFLAEVSRALGQHDSLESQRAAAAWALWDARLRLASSAVDSVYRGAAALLVLSSGAGLFLGLVDANVVRGYLVALSAATILLALLIAVPSRMLNALVGVARAKAHAAQRTTPELKEEVRKAMGGLKHPLLIVIDDVDRLQRPQTQLLVQMIKANADLPKMVFLVIAQRETLEKHLTAEGQAGSDYLQKIVQVPFDVPVVDQTKIDAVLYEGLQELRAMPGVNATFDETRWTNLYIGGLRAYFRNLRDVNRFIPTLRFYLALLQSNAALNVNPIDLIGLEVVRLFEPRTYARLAMLKATLTNVPTAANRTFVTNSLAPLFDAESTAHPRELRDIVADLFPTVAGAIGGTSFGSDPRDAWAKQLRVCTDTHFDRYFQLVLSVTDISQSELNSFLALQSRGDVAAALRALIRDGRASSFLDRLDAFKEDIPEGLVVAFATGLLDVADEVPEGEPKMFAIDPPMRVARLLYWSMKRLTADERGAAMVEAVRATTGFYTAAYVTELEIESLEKKEDNALPQARVDELRELALDKIRAAARDGRLEATNRLGSALFLWRKWAGDEEPRLWADSAADRPAGLTALVRGFTSYVISSSKARTKTRWYLRVTDLEVFVPLERLRLASAAHQAPLPQREDLALKEALARRDAGKPDYDPATTGMREN